MITSGDNLHYQLCILDCERRDRILCGMSSLAIYEKASSTSGRSCTSSFSLCPFFDVCTIPRPLCNANGLPRLETTSTRTNHGCYKIAVENYSKMYLAVRNCDVWQNGVRRQFREWTQSVCLTVVNHKYLRWNGIQLLIQSWNFDDCLYPALWIRSASSTSVGDIDFCSISCPRFRRKVNWF